MLGTVIMGRRNHFNNNSIIKKVKSHCYKHFNSIHNTILLILYSLDY